MNQYYDYYNLAKTVGSQIIKNCDELHELCNSDNTRFNRFVLRTKKDGFYIESIDFNCATSLLYETGSHSWKSTMQNGIASTKHIKSVLYSNQEQFIRYKSNFPYDEIETISYVENNTFGSDLLFQLETTYTEDEIKLISFWKGLQENVTIKYSIVFNSVNQDFLIDFNQSVRKNLIDLKINERYNK